MIKVLVVHDRSEVLAEVARIVVETVPEASVEVAEDGIGARQLLGQTIYDLLIIDLTLPHIKGRGHADYRVADDLLQELFSVGSLNIPGDVIGLTKDVEALDLINTSLGPHLMVAICEDDDGKWRSFLKDKVAYASRAAVTRQVSLNQQYCYDALIITALDKEFRPFSDVFDFFPSKYFNGAVEFVFNDRDGALRRGAAYPIGKSGQPRAASVTQSLVSFFRPRLALMSGFCGGVKGKAKLGDLIIFDTVYDWDYGKWEMEATSHESSVPVFWSRPSPISIDGSTAHQVARALVESDFKNEPELVRHVLKKSGGKLKSFDVYLAPAASGSAVIAEESVVRHIRGLNESIRAVDMESFGFYHACSQTRVVHPAFICMKAVADYCNGDKADEFHEACSDVAAAAVVEIITRQWKF
jgi:nucleoside phosphorylase